MDAPTKLRRYLRRKKLAACHLADLIGVDQAQVSRYLNQDQIPDLLTAVKMERATRGVVKHIDWVKAYLP